MTRKDVMMVERSLIARAMCLGLFLALSGLAFAQSKVIELKSANTLEGRRIGDEEVQELTGNVHFVHISSSGEEIKVWSDRALRYLKQNKVELFGNVRLVRDSIDLRAPEGVYFGDTRRSEMRHGVTMRRGSLRLTSTSGQYFSDERKAVFVGDVVVVDSTSTTRCDALTYFEADERSIAVGRVQVADTKSAITIFGDSLVHFDKIKYTHVPKNPRLVQIDTTADGVPDTLVVVSRLMEAFREPTERFVATDSVLLVGTDLAARCARATFYTKEDRILLERQPVVWYGSNQVTGDTMTITLENRKLKSVLVRGRAMAISRSDSLFAHRFDQIAGREITLQFEDQKLKRIEALRNATSLYYLYEEGRPNGVNRTSGDRIRVDFAEGRVENITVVGGVEGRYFPETMIQRREPQYNLDGFRWIEQRPKRRQLEIIP
jgi:lipopolysaccharide export system protein LptA